MDGSEEQNAPAREPRGAALSPLPTGGGGREGGRPPAVFSVVRVPLGGAARDGVHRSAGEGGVAASVGAADDRRPSVRALSTSPRRDQPVGVPVWPCLSVPVVQPPLDAVLEVPRSSVAPSLSGTAPATKAASGAADAAVAGPDQRVSAVRPARRRGHALPPRLPLLETWWRGASRDSPRGIFRDSITAERVGAATAAAARTRRSFLVSRAVASQPRTQQPVDDSPPTPSERGLPPRAEERVRQDQLAAASGLLALGAAVRNTAESPTRTVATAAADARLATARFDAALAKARYDAAHPKPRAEQSVRSGELAAARTREDAATRHRFVVRAWCGLTQVDLSDNLEALGDNGLLDWRFSGAPVPRLPPPPPPPSFSEIVRRLVMSARARGVPAVSYSRPSAGKGKGRQTGGAAAATAAMGTGPAWTAEEDLALALSAKEVQLDPITGTDQTWDEMFGVIFALFKVRMGVANVPNAQQRRTAQGVENRLRLMQKSVQEFKNILRRVENKNLTGNLTEEDMISAAVAEWSAMALYDAINGDRADDVQRGATKQRRPKQVHFPFLECWRVLRDIDKFSGAAAASAKQANSSRAASGGRASNGSPQDVARGQRRRRGTDVDSENDDEIEPACGKRRKYQESPMGHKAAREERAMAIAVQRYTKLSAESLSSLAASNATRTALSALMHPSRINSEATRRLLEMQEKKWLGPDWKGSKDLSGSGGASSAAGPAEPTISDSDDSENEGEGRSSSDSTLADQGRASAVAVTVPPVNGPARGSQVLRSAGSVARARGARGACLPRNGSRGARPLSGLPEMRGGRRGISDAGCIDLRTPSPPASPPAAAGQTLPPAGAGPEGAVASVPVPRFPGGRNVLGALDQPQLAPAAASAATTAEAMRGTRFCPSERPLLAACARLPRPVDPIARATRMPSAWPWADLPPLAGPVAARVLPWSTPTPSFGTALTGGACAPLQGPTLPGPIVHGAPSGANVAAMGPVPPQAAAPGAVRPAATLSVPSPGSVRMPMTYKYDAAAPSAQAHDERRQ